MKPMTMPSATMPVMGVPQGFQTVTASVMCVDVRKQVEFMKKAFGAEERMMMMCPDTKRVMHAEVVVGTSVMMMMDVMPGVMSCGKSVKDLRGSPVGFYLYVQDVDAMLTRAMSAGAKVVQPVQDMFWGDRMCVVECPEGFQWSIATHMRDLTPEQMVEGQKKFVEAMKMAKGKN
jgi:PhnB protein